MAVRNDTGASEKRVGSGNLTGAGGLVGLGSLRPSARSSTRVQSRDGECLGDITGDFTLGQRYYFHTGHKIIELEYVIANVVTVTPLPVLRPLQRALVTAADVRLVRSA